MNYLTWAVPVALLMGLAGLGAFMWSLRSGQYDDLDGAAERVLLDDENDCSDRNPQADDPAVPSQWPSPGLSNCAATAPPKSSTCRRR